MCAGSNGAQLHDLSCQRSNVLQLDKGPTSYQELMYVSISGMYPNTAPVAPPPPPPPPPAHYMTAVRMLSILLLFFGVMSCITGGVGIAMVDYAGEVAQWPTRSGSGIWCGLAVSDARSVRRSYPALIARFMGPNGSHVRPMNLAIGV